MSPSKTLFYLCISFVLGVAAESIVYNFAPEYVKSRATYVVLGFLLLGVAIVIVAAFLEKNILAVVGFCLFFFCLGLLRFQISEFTIANDALRQLNDKPGNITLTGYVAGEPDVRDTTQKLTVKVGSSLVLVTLDKFPPYQYLDTLEVTGKLKTPMVFDDFNYQNYLLKDGIYSVMDFPKAKLVSDVHQYNLFTFLYEKILFFKSKIRDSIYKNFSSPQNLLLEGIMLGNNKNMTAELRNELNSAGLRYLTAISGVHVIVISLILMPLLLALGFWRGQAFYISIAFIWLYIVLTGFSASGIRAAIMGSIFLLSQKFGRQNTSARTITIAAALMLLQNPLLLPYDVGFQLSFLASLGIIYFKPLFEAAIKTVTKERFSVAVEMLAVTITAQIFIFPILIYNFGTVSLVAPITSILVLPIMPWIIIFGFTSSVLAIVWNVLGFIFAAPCWLLLEYFLKVLAIFSQPWAMATVQSVSWLWLAGYYVILFAIVIWIQKFKKPKFLGF